MAKQKKMKAFAVDKKGGSHKAISRQVRNAGRRERDRDADKFSAWQKGQPISDATLIKYGPRPGNKPEMAKFLQIRPKPVDNNPKPKRLRGGRKRN